MRPVTHSENFPVPQFPGYITLSDDGIDTNQQQKEQDENIYDAEIEANKPTYFFIRASLINAR